MNHKLKWKFHLLHSSGKLVHDTIALLEDMEAEKGGILAGTCSFRLDPQLLNKLYVLHLRTKGSVWLIINNKTFLKTGFFDSESKNNLPEGKQEIYREISFQDTIQNISLYYIPPVLSSGSIEKLELGELSWRDQNINDDVSEKQLDIFSGTFHLAFAIIFLIIFLFHKAALENLYFAIYATIVGTIKITNTLDLPESMDFIGYYYAVAFELLSIFLSRVILNKEKSKIPLILLLVISPVLSFFGDHIAQDNVSVMLIFSFGLFGIVIYIIFSNLYYLIQGFSKKKWESKVITTGFFSGLLLLILLFILMIVFSQTQNVQYLERLVKYMPPLGLLTLLITMSIVLGRKNGENQKNLTFQLNEIKTLSQQNLDREIEKKQILENQNVELEKMVTIRTKEVTEQKEIIEIKNKEVTDNLLYAKRIQSAILPDVDVIKKLFTGFFVFYKPKDIVSGDFYSCIQREGQILLACADCTGHGVSGAFMSMIGSSLFNQIVNERNITDPSEILRQLNSEVISSLKQKYSDSHDGMDIAVCSIHLKSGYLNYAGANRPLWIIRNDQLMEFKPDKFPIGGDQFSQKESFKKHTIEILSGDMLYLTTDGFADQFGGPAGKKIMTKHFKKFLLTIQKFPMEEQQKQIQLFFHEWKGNREQVDDVLIIGIKI